MKRLELKAEVREETGKGVARRLRREGLIPGVLYGKDRQPVNLKLDVKEANSVVGGNAIIDVTLDSDETVSAMIKESQRDVIKGNLLHIDLYQISLDQKVEVEVPVELVGQPAGATEGGILEQILREVAIECLPTNIPEKVEVDVSELEIGQSLDVASIETEDDINIISSSDETVATVVIPTELDLEPADEEEEMAEPEVIGAEPDEEDEEEEIEE